MSVSLLIGDRIICDSVPYTYLGCCRYSNYVFQNPEDGRLLTFTWPEILHWWNEGALQIEPLASSARARTRGFIERINGARSKKQPRFHAFNNIDGDLDD